MQTSRPWPPRSPSHRPAAVGESAAGILTLPGGCLHDTAGARKAFRVSRMVVSFGYARFLRAVWTARLQQTHRTRSPGADHWHHHWSRRTTGRHDRRTAVPLGHHARDPCSQTDPICAPELMDAAVPAAATNGGSTRGLPGIHVTRRDAVDRCARCRQQARRGVAGLKVAAGPKCPPMMRANVPAAGARSCLT
jgi:hypothetical protein